MIRERASLGKDAAALAGLTAAGMSNPPYDYDSVTKKLVVNDAEAKVVKGIF
jgi:hypothetical protein